MHPGFIGFWQRARAGAQAAHGEGFGAWAGHCGGWPRGGPARQAEGACGGVGFAADGEGDFGGGAFGVRRPLRFLAHKLELREEQVEALAVILDELKTERAQSAVDARRSTAAFADAFGNATFDDARAKEIAAERVKTQERLQAAVASALGKIHALLNEEQRKRLAYLLRTGTLSV
jgi:Spy/CpxP family protein refolding chaperone